MPRILINEDDLATRKMLRFILEQQGGYVIVEADSAEAALEMLGRERCDLVVTDLVLPGADGYELVRRIRRISWVPILVVSARAEIPDRVRGLRTGADDYLGKPFDPSELLARVEALLRRARHVATEEAGVIRAGALSIDLKRQVASVEGGGQVRLTPTELRMLTRLAQPPGEVHSRDELAEAIWGAAPNAAPSAITTYVAELRRKLERAGGRPRLLQTVRGAGYRLDT